eukprot:TRINITY_DN11745_c0_g1_i1.p1 TRINITY_DN11745_c0_g1~~TRINITY_DN11745_c0_g1_i1.p1  ORF type:complete len:1246 (+),score=263.24 TRINITY_DN11745_c0_g1_i1:414-3740(+)
MAIKVSQLGVRFPLRMDAAILNDHPNDTSFLVLNVQHIRGAFARGRLGLGEIQGLLIRWSDTFSAREPSSSFVPDWDALGLADAVLVSQARLRLFTDTVQPELAQAGLLRLGIKWTMSGLEGHFTPRMGRFLAETAYIVKCVFQSLSTLTSSAEADDLYKKATLSDDPVNKLLVATAYTHERDLAQQQLANADAQVIALLKRHLRETQRLLRARLGQVPESPTRTSEGLLPSRQSMYNGTSPEAELMWVTHVDLEVVLKSSCLSLYCNEKDIVLWQAGSVVVDENTSPAPREREYSSRDNDPPQCIVLPQFTLQMDYKDLPATATDVSHVKVRGALAVTAATSDLQYDLGMIKFVNAAAQQWRDKEREQHAWLELQREVVVDPDQWSEVAQEGVPASSFYTADLELSDGRPLDLGFHCFIEGVTVVLSCQTEAAVQCKVVLPAVQVAINSARNKSVTELRKEVNITAIVDHGVIEISHPRGYDKESALSLSLDGISITAGRITKVSEAVVRTFVIAANIDDIHATYSVDKLDDIVVFLKHWLMRNKLRLFTPRETRPQRISSVSSTQTLAFADSDAESVQVASPKTTSDNSAASTQADRSYSNTESFWDTQVNIRVKLRRAGIRANINKVLGDISLELKDAVLHMFAQERTGAAELPLTFNTRLIANQLICTSVGESLLQIRLQLDNLSIGLHSCRKLELGPDDEQTCRRLKIQAAALAATVSFMKIVILAMDAADVKFQGHDVWTSIPTPQSEFFIGHKHARIYMSKVTIPKLTSLADKFARVFQVQRKKVLQVLRKIEAYEVLPSTSTDGNSTSATETDRSDNTVFGASNALPKARVTIEGDQLLLVLFTNSFDDADLLQVLLQDYTWTYEQDEQQTRKGMRHNLYSHLEIGSNEPNGIGMQFYSARRKRAALQHSTSMNELYQICFLNSSKTALVSVPLSHTHMISWLTPASRSIQGLFMLEPKRDGFRTNVVENILDIKKVVDKYLNEITRYRRLDREDDNGDQDDRPWTVHCLTFNDDIPGEFQLRYPERVLRAQASDGTEHDAACAFELDFTRNTQFLSDSSVRFFMNEYLRDHETIHRFVALNINYPLASLANSLSKGLTS